MKNDLGNPRASRVLQKKASIALNIAYGLAVLLFLLDELTGFDIKSQLMKSSIYIGLLITTPLILIWNAFFIKPTPRKIACSLLPAGMLIGIAIAGPVRILSAAGAWQTQTILYENAHLGVQTIEFQMQDVGARGYNKRTVEVLYLTCLFMLTNEVPGDIADRPEWMRVDKEINELGLKLP